MLKVKDNDRLLKLEDSSLVEELSNNAAQRISAGYEVFTIRNETEYYIWYTVDGTGRWENPGWERTWTTYGPGTITYDEDVRAEVVHNISHNLVNGRVYAFRDLEATPGNPHDIRLFHILGA